MTIRGEKEEKMANPIMTDLVTDRRRIWTDDAIIDDDNRIIDDIIDNNRIFDEPIMANPAVRG
ncbi:MAG: hypothetical protein A4E48_01640 [Methanosaeta sp. PtaU1.Bin060]|nr:MAG: hypothetical protein A4E48_01640 [Methanosaeta sp. PtaU1.Bin060]